MSVFNYWWRDLHVCFVEIVYKKIKNILFKKTSFLLSGEDVFLKINLLYLY